MKVQTTVYFERDFWKWFKNHCKENSFNGTEIIRKQMNKYRKEVEEIHD